MLGVAALHPFFSFFEQIFRGRPDFRKDPLMLFLLATSWLSAPVLVAERCVDSSAWEVTEYAYVKMHEVARQGHNINSDPIC